MQENSIGEVWRDLSLWRKLTITIFFIMWLAFSGEIIIASDGNVFATVISLCLLWLAYLAIAYFVAKFASQ